MAAEEEKCRDLYAVLGLERECSEAELRNAYKKLAMKWHPDRCSASGNSDHMEESKKKFQAIQQAYSVLSDANKRFLYDVRVYDSDDENDENGMGDFLNEMVSMMSQSKQNEKRNSSFEELQQLFEDIFHNEEATDSSSPSTQEEASQDPSVETLFSSNKRNSPCHVATSNYNDEPTKYQELCIEGMSEGEIRGQRKQKISSGADVSSGDYSTSHIRC